jgi:hypothetical protein
MNAAMLERSAQSIEELLLIVAQQKREIEALNAMLDCERSLRKTSNARLIAAGRVYLAKAAELDTIIAAAA